MNKFSFFFSWLSFQSRFPILICNKTAAEAYGQFQKQPPKVFCKKGVLKNFAHFTGKHLCWSLFLIQLQVFRPATLLKRDSNAGAFLRNLKIFKSTYFEEYLRTTASVVSFSMFIIYVIDLSTKNKMQRRRFIFLRK